MGTRPGREVRPKWAEQGNKGMNVLALDTDLGDLLAFEHLRHNVPQFLQVIQDSLVGCNVLLRFGCGPSQLIAEWDA